MINNLHRIVKNVFGQVYIRVWVYLSCRIAVPCSFELLTNTIFIYRVSQEERT